MWVIDEIKKDLIRIGLFFLGIVTIMYLVLGRFDVSFVKHLMRMLTAVLCMGGFILMQNSEGKRANNVFKLLAISYRFAAISSILYLMIRSHYGTFLNSYYLRVKIATDFFEVASLYTAYCFVKREFNPSKMYYINFAFFIMTMYVALSPQLISISFSHLVTTACYLEAFSAMMLLVLIYLSRPFVHDIDKRIILRLYLFLGFKTLYQGMSFIYIYTNAYVGDAVLILLRLIYIYQLIACLFYERMSLPWEDLILKVKRADGQLNAVEKEKHLMINLSHELKTPVHVIKSAADLLSFEAEKEKDIEQLTELEIIKKNCYNATKLITHIIDSSKLDEGYIRPKLKPYSLAAVLQYIILAFRAYQPNWQIVMEDKEEIDVMLDLELIQRGLINLISILIYFQRQEAEILIRLEEMDQKAYVTLICSSTVLPDEYSNERTISYNKENISGLAAFQFSKKIIKFHSDSQIYCSSSAEKGTMIVIQLTLADEICKVQKQEIEEEEISRLISLLRMQCAEI